MFSKDALVLMTKATELFVMDLSGVCAQIAKVQKRKTLQVGDINNAAASIEKFHFIKESKLPSLSTRPLNFPGKLEEIEEKAAEDENANNLSENEDFNAALEAELDDDAMEWSILLVILINS